MSNAITYIKIEIFIPESYITVLRNELNALGVGHIGNYDHCISITTVQAYWRPLVGATPYAGEVGKINSAPECKVEVSCRYDKAQEALQVIKNIHPYDKPLINIIPLLNHNFEGLEL